MRSASTGKSRNPYCFDGSAHFKQLNNLEKDQIPKEMKPANFKAFCPVVPQQNVYIAKDTSEKCQENTLMVA